MQLSCPHHIARVERLSSQVRANVPIVCSTRRRVMHGGVVRADDLRKDARKRSAKSRSKLNPVEGRILLKASTSA